MAIWDDIYNMLVTIYNIIVSLPNVIGIVYDVIAWIISGILNIINFIVMLFSLATTLTGLLWGFLGAMFSANPYATVVFGLIMTCFTIIIFVRVWNLIADIELWGFKLPKL